MSGVPELSAGSAFVLVVEDEPSMQVLLKDNLEFEGYRVSIAATAEDALATILRDTPSLLLLDIMLPHKSGLELCRALRERGLHTPIIMLTALASESDRVVGLDIGADDYVTKPFGVQDLLARVRAQLRRNGFQNNGNADFAFGDIRVFTCRRLVTRRGKRVNLSAREFDLLRYLLAHRGEVVSRQQLLRDVWGYQELLGTRTVDNFVAKLRMHIEPTPHDPHHLVTIHGIGYQLL
jgi:DNA-binding response OmpR family regulator